VDKGVKNDIVFSQLFKI